MARSTFRSRASTVVLVVCLGAALAVPTAMVPAGAQEATPSQDPGVVEGADLSEAPPAEEAPAAETPTVDVSAPPGTKGGRVLSSSLEALATNAVEASRSGAEPAADVATVQAQLDDLEMPTEGAGSIMVRDDGAVVVNINVTDTSPQTVAGLQGAGARIITVSADYQMVSAEVAIGDLTGVAAAPGVLAVTEVVVPMTTANAQEEAGTDAPPVSTNLVNCATNPTGLRSEGDTQLAVATARASSAVDGTGIKVGVLSDTYDRLGGANADVLNAELPGTGNPCTDPTPVEVLDPGPTVDVIDEGRAMAQIVHDLAPEATIAFSSAFNGDLDFADEIRKLRLAGAKVIVDDVSYFNEPFYQDGPIAKAVNDVTAGGVTYFSSAANSTPASVRTGGSYEAPSYRNMACPATILAVDAGYVGCHDYDTTAGADNGNTMTIPAGATFRTTLGWNEPMYGVGTDLDYFLVNQSNGTILAGSVGINANTKSPIEYLQWRNASASSATIALVVAKYGSGGTPRFKTIVHRNPATSVQFSASVNGDVAGPTIFGHNANLRSGSIAAVPFNNASTIEAFSSRGPATYCWQPVSGTSPSAAMACQTKNLDVAATHGTINSFFGSPGCTICRFYGTSAAAPHAAAIAALQKQKQPCRTPAEILAAQRSSAVAFGGFGVADYGSGRVTATTAITGLATCPAAVAAGYHPLTPSRILDSRTANGGWNNSRLPADTSRELQVTGRAPSSIPANATAVVMNVTATDSTAGSFLKIWPAGTVPPNVSSLNFVPGQTIPNLVTVKLGTGGRVELANAVGAAHVVADVVGYFDNGSGPGDRFTGMGPLRLLDSRGNNGGWNSAKLPKGTTRDLIVRQPGRVDGAPAGATAIIANVTVVGATQESFLRVWPSGEAEPDVSNLNFKPEQIIPNLVMIKIGTNGRISFSNAEGATHVVVDIVGYFNPTTGSKFFAVDPTRVLDSRVAKGLTGPWSAGQTRDLTLAGAPGTNVPDAADGVIANVTVTDGTAQSLITVFPSGAGVPTSSNLNFMAGEVIPNLVTVRIPANNKISIYNDQGSVNVIADVVGYFAP